MPKEEAHTCCPPPVCINCKEDHDARNKNCRVYKREQEAVNKANDEFISVGHAKKLLSRTPRYNEVVKSGSGGNASGSKDATTNDFKAISSQSVRPKENRQNDATNDRLKKNGRRLSASQLGISTAAGPSSVEVSGPQTVREPRAFSEAPQASIEASQAPTVEGASQSSLPDLGEGLIDVEVHHPGDKMETSSFQHKRSRDLSSSPPSSQIPSVLLSNRFAALSSGGDQDSRTDRPFKKPATATKVEHIIKNSSKPSLLRPPGAGKAKTERPAKSRKPSTSK